MFARVYGAQATLLSGECVSVETDLSRGLHSFTIVGLPDKAVEESRDRVSAAIKNSDFASPKSQNQKIVISLAPADIKKEGPAFDVPIALSYLLAAEVIHFNPASKLFAGELALDGEVRPIKGAIAIARAARSVGFTELFIPTKNAKEAAIVEGVDVYPVSTLRTLIDHLEGKVPIAPLPRTIIEYSRLTNNIALEDIRGQESGKRALEIAAAGGHNLVLHGPPGTGKTMLAKALCGILPPLSTQEVIIATTIHSVAGLLQEDLITHPPFRSPHHTSSYVSLVGGGAVPKPGEVTLAHTGVLFLDEFPEFERRVIDALRQPLEERSIHISRAKGTMTFPARFILVAAMNPCPCGNFGSSKPCICTPLLLSKYQKKVSGPIIDRIDLWIEIPHIAHELLEMRPDRIAIDETSAVRDRVANARKIQRSRFESAHVPIETNSEMHPKALEKLGHITKEGEAVLQQAAKTLDLSPRAYHRILKVARTIADLEGDDAVESGHILEALQYRPKKQAYV